MLMLYYCRCSLGVSGGTGKAALTHRSPAEYRLRPVTSFFHVWFLQRVCQELPDENWKEAPKPVFVPIVWALLLDVTYSSLF